MNQLRYTFETEGKILVGWLDDYPEHPTQAFSIAELEDNLRDIYSLILEGCLETQQHGVLEFA